MQAYFSYLNQLVTTNKTNYAAYPGLRWLNPYEASVYQEQRDRLMAEVGEDLLFKDTKPFYRSLSDGCQLCGKGFWSCLFITGKCNANCFYCPTSQEQDELPTTQGLSFTTAEAYAEYVNFFKFRGVSFSGGEPLLVKERVLEYLQAIRKHCDPSVYTWMYTNGLLAKPEIFEKLAQAGLDEVRFDIGATNYQLDKLRSATGCIKNITVEIPAVPEDKEQLMELLPKLIEAGVTHLNLHQLRLTPYNGKRLEKHNYTYIPAEKPIVLESELAALEVLVFAKKQQLPIGVNYCSFFFKNRFQPAGFRTRLAEYMKKAGELVTESGYIRQQEPGRTNYYVCRISDTHSLPDGTPLLLDHKQYTCRKDLVHIAYESDPKPGEFPELDYAFKISRFEEIEKGLREY